MELEGDKGEGNAGREREEGEREREMGGKREGERD